MNAQLKIHSRLWFGGYTAGQLTGLLILGQTLSLLGGLLWALLFGVMVYYNWPQKSKEIAASRPFTIEPTDEDKALALEMYNNGITESYVSNNGAIVDVKAIGDAHKANEERKAERQRREEAMARRSFDCYDCDYTYDCDCMSCFSDRVKEAQRAIRRDANKHMVPVDLEIKKNGKSKLNYNVYEIRQLGNFYVGTVNGTVKFQTFDADEAEDWLMTR